MAKQRLKMKVEPHGKTATFFHVPDEVVAKLSSKRRVPVRVTVNKHTYRSTIGPMGGDFLLPLNRENREKAGVAAGKVVDVVLEFDAEERVVEVPADLVAALKKDAKASKNFEGMSYSHKREYVEWITGAKREETRERRIGKAIERLREGRTAS